MFVCSLLQQLHTMLRLANHYAVLDTTLSRCAPCAAEGVASDKSGSATLQSSHGTQVTFLIKSLLRPKYQDSMHDAATKNISVKSSRKTSKECASQSINCQSKRRSMVVDRMIRSGGDQSIVEYGRVNETEHCTAF